MNPATNPHLKLPLADLLAQLAHAAALPFDRAKPIPPGVNHSEAFLAHEMETVFMGEWICVGRTDEVENFGDFLTHEIAGIPVLVVRQNNGDIHAFVNACAHRRACIVNEATGSARRFTCPYHAWTYDCGGHLIAAPYMDMKPGFEKSDHRLRRLQCRTWEGFIYVSLAPDPATEPEQVLAPLRDGVVGRFDMACYRTVLRETLVWEANWKNLVENFIESYHVPMAHGQTFAKHDKPLDTYICGEDSDYYCYHRSAQPGETGRGAAHPANRRLEGEWRRMMVDFCVFPCHLVTLMPDYVWYISVQPAGTDRMHATWGAAIPPENLADIPESELETWAGEFRDYLNVANEEDRVLVEALHRGSRSTLLPEGTYHPIERNLWQFNRYLAGICGAR